ncbi:cache domain-containing protein [Vibrio sp. SCSIO 43137]|uniref:cache domain-containing protein n=1 Tax=Vibrio sp. SCSIO 43137 TaxID=3021011 RepID=UPI002306EA35|nr:cache domain-containing protein [Vibrio sp. SCSIO 43137]WCE31425.1 cache domain-containing protein [Vibrio sp. SCSIO 43137]
MNNGFLFHSLRKVNISTRLVFGFTFIFICFLLFFSWTSYQNAYKLINKEINADLLSHTLLIKKNISSTAEATIKNYLRSKTEFVYQYAEEQYKRYLAGEISESDAKNKVFDLIKYRSIARDGYHYIINSDGIVLQHINPQLIGTNINHFGHIRDQVSKKAGYIEYEWRNEGELEHRDKSLDMSYFKPWDWIISSSAYKDDVLELVNIEDFSAVISSIKFGKTGYTYILDRDANFIYHPFLSGSAFHHAKERSMNSDFFKKIINDQEGVVSYLWKNPEDNDYRNKIAVFSYIEKFRWTVVSSTYPEEFYAPLTQLRSYYIGLVFISLLIATPIVMFFSYSIVAPIQNVIAGITKAKKEGNQVRIRLDGYSNDEVAILARSFNSFLKQAERNTEKLNSQIGKIQQSEAKQVNLNTILNNKIIELLAKLEKQREELDSKVLEIQNIQDKLIASTDFYNAGRLAIGVTGIVNANLAKISASTSSSNETIEYLIGGYKNMTLTNEQLEQSIHKLSDYNQALNNELNKTINIAKCFESISGSCSPSNLIHFSVSELINRTIESLHPLLESNSLTINSSFDQDVIITSRPEYFNAIFYSLVFNSIDHYPDLEKEGNSEIKISFNEDSSHLHLIYFDNCCAAKKHSNKNMFKSSEYRHSTQFNFELNTARYIVKNKLNGKINFVSSDDGGFIIEITIPKTESR